MTLTSFIVGVLLFCFCYTCFSAGCGIADAYLAWKNRNKKPHGLL